METILQGVTTDADWRLYYEANPNLLPRTSFDADSHIKHHSHVSAMPANEGVGVWLREPVSQLNQLNYRHRIPSPATQHI